ncbi:MAG: hypothetical protein K0S46_2067 [Moraxellaceae bacterium]|jgi:hypothetical protein|nr:hypothetical protein [Moraxellaceae bacterium]
MRCALSLLLLAAPVAQAALPLYNTDMIKAGEALASFSSSRSELQFDSRYSIAGNPSVVEPLLGVAEVTTKQTGLVLVFGLRDNLNAYLSGGFSESDFDTAFQGRFVNNLPIRAQYDARQEGFDDLGAGLEYRLFASAATAMVARVAVLIPTASDYSGTTAETVNGIQFTTLDEGRRGRGYTRVSPQLAGSTKWDRTVLEYELSMGTDDEKDTEDTYGLQLGVLQHIGNAAYMRLSGSASWQQGMRTATLSTNDIAAYTFTLTAGYFITPNVRLAASGSYGWADDAEVDYVSGDRVQHGNQEQEGLGLSITYMLP